MGLIPRIKMQIVVVLEDLLRDYVVVLDDGIWGIDSDMTTFDVDLTIKLISKRLMMLVLTKATYNSPYCRVSCTSSTENQSARTSQYVHNSGRDDERTN